MSSYALNRDIRSFEAAADVEGYRIAAASGSGKKVRAANGNTDKIVGAAERVGADAGAMLDVTVAGVTELRLGGTVDFMDPLTSDAQGRAIKAVVAGNAAVRIVGFAHDSGVIGDIIPVQVALGFLTKPAA